MSEYSGMIWAMAGGMATVLFLLVVIAVSK
jgi:hypothetical protein